MQGRQGAGRVGQGRAGQAGRRQGAGHRAQGQGTKGRVGLQDSILRFSKPKTSKIKFLQLWAKAKGQSRVARFHFEVFKA